MAVTLHMHRWGAGSRRVLLLHGITSAGSGWWRVGPDLASRGWSVYAPDLRGHGESPMASSYRFSDHVDDVLGLGSGWDVVVGHSMGAAVAVLAATTDPAFAGRLVLQDPALIVALDRDQLLTWLLADFDGPMTGDWVLEQNPRYHREDARMKALALRQTMREIIEQTALENEPWNVLAEAASLIVPTVVLASDPAAGGIVPITIGEWLAAENPAVDYRMIEGAGHSAHRERDMYDTYLESLVEVLGQVGEQP